jgi:hypothetical protein
VCLSEVYTDEDMNRIVEELPEVAPEVVEVWKIARNNSTIACAYRAPCEGKKYPTGHGGAEQKKLPYLSYYTGYHFCLSKSDANDWHNSPYPDYCHAIKCYILKEWITCAGKQRGLGVSYIAVEVLVASQAFFPTYPETEAKLGDFLRWLKDNDKEYTQKYLCAGGANSGDLAGGRAEGKQYAVRNKRPMLGR